MKRYKKPPTGTSPGKAFTLDLSRRSFLKKVTGLPLGLFLGGSPLQAQSTPRRFVQFFLFGGWDSALATDPLTGSKRSSSTYESAYLSRDLTTVTGKSNLVIGDGLAPAEPAFAAMNTAFVNGMYVEVTAHELASKYILSGRATLSRSREFPAIAAIMGDASGNFPPHLNLGLAIPLGDTRQSNPPIHALSSDHLATMLSGPRTGEFFFNDAGVTAMNNLVSTLDTLHGNAISSAEQAKLNAWNVAAARLDSIYSPRYDLSMNLTDDIRSRYGITDSWMMESNTASAYLALSTGLSSYITIAGAGYDTHQGHLGAHVPLMQTFATTLNTFVTDLRNTADPDDSSQTLADTTTILITSEFCRTPAFNIAGGTDHWKSASAILMGAGIRDNTIVGSTGDDAMPLGWVNAAAVPYTSETELNSAHLNASVVRYLGYNDQADIISTTHLSELFT